MRVDYELYRLKDYSSPCKRYYTDSLNWRYLIVSVFKLTKRRRRVSGTSLIAYFAIISISARVRIRAKFKHISRRSVIKETNQDSLSNGE